MPRRRTDSEDQFDLFPARPEIEPLDPAVVASSGPNVKGIWRVRLGHARELHMVYHDRHGWYCAEHGRDCVAVRTVRDR